jgi:hypothetical protein
LTAALLIEHCENRFEQVGVLRSLVVAPAKDSWKADGHARLVPSRASDPLEAEFEDELRLDSANRSKLTGGVFADEAIDLANLGVVGPEYAFAKLTSSPARQTPKV